VAKELIIFGAGDIARLAHFYFTTDTDYKVAGFVVDAEYRKEDSFRDLPLTDFESIRESHPPDRYDAFVAVSYAKMNRVRQEKFEKLKAWGYTCAAYVSSHCTYLAPEPPGENAFILEDNTIQPFVKIGSNVTLWSGNHIGHDSVIQDNTFIASHIVVSGNCVVGKNCFLGVNATMHNSITLGDFTLVAAGAIVAKSTREYAVIAPARSTFIDKKSIDLSL